MPEITEHLSKSFEILAQRQSRPRLPGTPTEFSSLQLRVLMKQGFSSPKIIFLSLQLRAAI